ncbi:GNAT family N-acetyltransferase [Acinetobacter baumannii]|uniref:GNAT family N-acetyltransferase n=1 Tax=Acinetobacter baumannii TaxID=470 RepID=UPI003218E4B3
MQKKELVIQQAKILDSRKIQKLVNKAYSSSDAGRSWTNESRVVSGERITVEQLQELFNAKNTSIIIAKLDRKIVGTVTLINESYYVKLNMLAVDPEYQQYGIGKQLLQYSEQYLLEEFQSKKIRIDVVSSRTELIAFYERRGYVNCNTTYPYPTHLVSTRPYDLHLNVEVFEKILG